MGKKIRIEVDGPGTVELSADDEGTVTPKFFPRSKPEDDIVKTKSKKSGSVKNDVVSFFTGGGPGRFADDPDGNLKVSEVENE